MKPFRATPKCNQRLQKTIQERNQFALNTDLITAEHETMKKSHNSIQHESNKWKMEHKRLQSTNAKYQVELADLKSLNHSLQTENQRLQATTR